MNKLVIIINGKGSCGKDTLCNLASKHFKVRNISYVDPIKRIATLYGGWNGSKDTISRKFLSDLDDIFENYGNPQIDYVNKEYQEFKTSDDQIMFVHCRKPHAIHKLLRFMQRDDGCKWVTLLITNPLTDGKIYGNTADDIVDNFKYDYTFENDVNNCLLSETEKMFYVFIKNIIRNIYGE